MNSLQYDPESPETVILHEARLIERRIQELQQQLQDYANSINERIEAHRNDFLESTAVEKYIRWFADHVNGRRDELLLIGRAHLRAEPHESVYGILNDTVFHEWMHFPLDHDPVVRHRIEDGVRPLIEDVLMAIEDQFVQE